MQNLLAAVKSYIPGLIAAGITILPSIIVALTNYPKEAGALKVILQILNVFSGLQHRNSPGTLKLPLTQSAPPAVVGTPVATSAAPAALVLLALLALPGLAACAGIPIENDLIICGSGVAVPAGAGVLAALTGPSNQVETSLEGLGLTYGVQSVECVVQDLVAQEEAKLAAAQGVQTAAYVTGSLPNLLVIVRGEQHLHGWRLSSGKLIHHRVQ